MDGKRSQSLGKVQASGMTAPGIDLGGATINSGYYSGRSDLESDLKKVLQNGKKCKGTDRSYNDANSDKIDSAAKTRDLGASSGDGKNTSGTLGEGNKGSSQTTTSQTTTNSNVIGTRQSFNVGSVPSKVESSVGVGKEVKRQNCKVRDEDYLKNKRIESGGTLGSFNAIGGGSKIDAEGATINSGSGAGINNDKVKQDLRKEIEKNWKNHYEDYECWGTEKSFNANGEGKQIYIKHAKLNMGAFAGHR